MNLEVSPAETVAWSGLDLRSGILGSLQAARTAVRERVWTPSAGRGNRYELLALASRVRPTAFLSSLELRSDHPHVEVLSEVAWHESLLVTWSLLYRLVAETGPEVVLPYAIYVLGVNPPPGLDDAETEEFNDFYTNVHMPEVAERRAAARAARYELVEEARPPARGGPRFLAVYEVDEDAAQHRAHVGPPYQRGPQVWQKHTTPWRFWYRRLAD